MDEDEVPGEVVDAREVGKLEARTAEAPQLEAESKEKLSATEEEDVKRLAAFLEPADAKDAPKDAKNTQQPEAVPVSGRSEKRI
jgi:hypothetical protein